MGNCLAYPPRREQLKREKEMRKMSRQFSQETTISTNSVLRDRPITLPYMGGTASFKRDDQDTELKTLEDPAYRLDLSQFELETTKFNRMESSRASSYHPSVSSTGRYIKRYKSEEEKLVDMLRERDAIMKSAVKQGQTLRAKCNRYKEELESMKALSDVDMTDVEWRRRYDELDDRYRTLKEDLDVMSARNSNGRNHLAQQEETIHILEAELRRQQMEKSRMMSNSMGSLVSVGAGSKKGRQVITQLAVDKCYLEDQLHTLSARNARGREYLSKLEAEKEEQRSMLTSMRTQLQREHEEKENLLAKVNHLRASQEHLAMTDHINESAVYAKVNKPTSQNSHQFARHNGHANPASEFTISTGFETSSNTRDASSSKYYTTIDQPYIEVKVDNIAGPRAGPREINEYREEIERSVSLASETPRDSVQSDGGGSMSLRLHRESPREYTTIGHVEIEEPIWESVPQTHVIKLGHEATTKF